MPDPSPAALAWASEVAGTPVRMVRRLLGGTHAVTVLLEPAMVLRQYPAGDDAPAREARVLQALDGLDGWVPRLVGVDAAEGRILITRLDGQADIMPERPAVAARELGQALARIHATEPPRVDTRPVVVPERLGRSEHVLTHYDFWSGNVLWDGPRLTGVVDWSGASRAPRGFDVAWCRLDLVLLHGKPVADVFLAAYQTAAGTEVDDLVLWDRFALAASDARIETWEPNYTSLGRTDLTGAELRHRHRAWAEDRGAAPL